MINFNNKNGVLISYNLKMLHMEYCVSYSDDITFEATYTKENIELFAKKIMKNKAKINDFVNDFGDELFIQNHLRLFHKIDMHDLFEEGYK